MKLLGKTLLIIAISAIYSLTWAGKIPSALNHTNIIIFGDSLSDIGNLPENPTVKTNNTYTENLYVPVSNPVNLNDPNARFVKYSQLYNLQKSYTNSWETSLEYTDFIRKNNDSLQPTIKGQARAQYSSNWSEFLTGILFKDNPNFSGNFSSVIVPSSVLELTKTPAVDQFAGVDYAWSSALSSAGCYTQYYDKITNNCSEKDILTSRENYIHNHNLARTTIEVPGLLTQIQMFKNDLNTKSRIQGRPLLTVNPNTIYAIWIGGNDLNKYFAQLEHMHGIKAKLDALHHLLEGIAYNNYKAIKELITNPVKQYQARNIYLFETFDVTLTPKVYNWSWVLRTIGRTFVKIYNAGLKLDVKLLKAKYPNVNIQIVPTYKWSQELASKKGIYAKTFGFYRALGKRCEDSNEGYNQPISNPENCISEKLIHGTNVPYSYMFWNDIHPTMAVEQIFGYLFAKENESTIKNYSNANNEFYNSGPNDSADIKKVIAANI